MGEGLYTEKEVAAFVGKMSGWVDGLSDRERTILAATLQPDDEVGGYAKKPETTGIPGVLEFTGILDPKNYVEPLGPAIQKVVDKANQATTSSK